MVDSSVQPASSQTPTLTSPKQAKLQAFGRTLHTPVRPLVRRSSGKPGAPGSHARPPRQGAPAAAPAHHAVAAVAPSNQPYATVQRISNPPSQMLSPDRMVPDPRVSRHHHGRHESTSTTALDASRGKMPDEVLESRAPASPAPLSRSNQRLQPTIADSSASAYRTATVSASDHRRFLPDGLDAGGDDDDTGGMIHVAERSQQLMPSSAHYLPHRYHKSVPRAALRPTSDASTITSPGLVELRNGMPRAEADPGAVPTGVTSRRASMADVSTSTSPKMLTATGPSVLVHTHYQNPSAPSFAAPSTVSDADTRSAAAGSNIATAAIAMPYPSPPRRPSSALLLAMHMMASPTAKTARAVLSSLGDNRVGVPRVAAALEKRSEQRMPSEHASHHEQGSAAGCPLAHHSAARQHDDQHRHHQAALTKQSSTTAAARYLAAPSNPLSSAARGASAGSAVSLRRIPFPARPWWPWQPHHHSGMPQQRVSSSLATIQGSSAARDAAHMFMEHGGGGGVDADGDCDARMPGRTSATTGGTVWKQVSWRHVHARSVITTAASSSQLVSPRAKLQADAVRRAVTSLRRWIAAQVTAGDREEASLAAARQVASLHVKRRVLKRLIARLYVRRAARLLAACHDRRVVAGSLMTWRNQLGTSRWVRTLARRGDLAVVGRLFQRWRTAVQRSINARARAVALVCHRLSRALAKWSLAAKMRRAVRTLASTARRVRCGRAMAAWRLFMQRRRRYMAAAERYHKQRLIDIYLPKVMLAWQIVTARRQYRKHAAILIVHGRLKRVLQAWLGAVQRNRTLVTTFRSGAGRLWKFKAVFVAWASYTAYKRAQRAAKQAVLAAGRHRLSKSTLLQWRSATVSSLAIKRRARLEGGASQLLSMHRQHTQRLALIKWSSVVNEQKALEIKQANMLKGAALTLALHRRHSLRAAVSRWLEVSQVLSASDAADDAKADEFGRRLILRRAIRRWGSYRVQLQRERHQVRAAIIHRGFIVLTDVFLQLRQHAVYSKRLKAAVLATQPLGRRLALARALRGWQHHAQAATNRKQACAILARAGRRVRLSCALREWQVTAQQRIAAAACLARVVSATRHRWLRAALTAWSHSASTLARDENRWEIACRRHRRVTLLRLMAGWRRFATKRCADRHRGLQLHISLVARIGIASLRRWAHTTRSITTERHQDEVAVLHHGAYLLRTVLRAWRKRAAAQVSKRVAVLTADSHFSYRVVRPALAAWRSFTADQASARQARETAAHHRRSVLLRNAWMQLVAPVRRMRGLIAINDAAVLHRQRRQAAIIIRAWRATVAEARLLRLKAASLMLAIRKRILTRHTFSTLRHHAVMATAFNGMMAGADELRRLHLLRRCMAAWKSMRRMRLEEKRALDAASEHYRRALLRRAFTALADEVMTRARQRRLASQLRHWILSTSFDQLRAYANLQRSKRRQEVYMSVAVCEGRQSVRAWASAAVTAWPHQPPRTLVGLVSDRLASLVVVFARWKAYAQGRRVSKAEARAIRSRVEAHVSVSALRRGVRQWRLAASILACDRVARDMAVAFHGMRLQAKVMAAWREHAAGEAASSRVAIRVVQKARLRRVLRAWSRLARTASSASASSDHHPDAAASSGRAMEDEDVGVPASPVLPPSTRGEIGHGAGIGRAVMRHFERLGREIRSSGVDAAAAAAGGARRLDSCPAGLVTPRLHADTRLRAAAKAHLQVVLAGIPSPVELEAAAW